MFQLSIFDDDDKRMTEIDDRCKDYRRLGSFFKPWYWDIKSYALLNHIDMDALENMCSNINWIHYDNFISDNGVNKIDIKNWFAHYISHIVLNEYIKNDNIYQDVKSYRKFKKDEFSYQLKENDIILTDILKEYCDDLIRNDLRHRFSSAPDRRQKYLQSLCSSERYAERTCSASSPIDWHPRQKHR